MSIAVFNARGAQAAAIAGRLEQAGHQVRRLSRSAGHGRIAIDPGDAGSITRALEGATAAVFTVPQDYRAGVREGYAERLVGAAERAGLERLVVNMGGPVFEGLDDPVTDELREIRSILTGGQVPTTVLQPTSFLDNMVEPWSLAAIVNEGVLAYPAASHLRISWISHQSLGDFAAAALRVSRATRQVLNIGGPAAVSCEELAEAVGRAAGRTVRYAQMPLADFAAALDNAFGPPAGSRIAALYRHYQAEPRAGERDPADWALLGAEPETVADWAGRQDWRVAAAAQA